MIDKQFDSVAEAVAADVEVPQTPGAVEIAAAEQDLAVDHAWRTPHTTGGLEGPDLLARTRVDAVQPLVLATDPDPPERYECALISSPAVY